MSLDDQVIDSPPADEADSSLDLEPGDDARVEQAHIGQDALFDKAPFENQGTPVGFPRYLSPSSASLFEQCPRRWKLRYVDGFVEPPGIEALVGTFAHRVLELLLDEPPARRTTDRAKELARKVWPETASNPDYLGLGLDEHKAREFRWRGWHAIEGLWRLEDPATVEVAATERRVRADIGGVPFLGVVDRIDRCADGLVVSDYKSGRAPSRRFEGSKLAQVLLYAAAVGAADGEAPVRARLMYLGSTIIEVDATAEAVAEAVEALRATWDAVGAAFTEDRFEPNPGPLCGWCPHVAECAEGLAEVKKRYDLGRLRADAPAHRLVA